MNRPHIHSDSDESSFYLSRQVNSQNNRYWPQIDIMVGVWCAMSATRIAKSISLLKPQIHTDILHIF